MSVINETVCITKKQMGFHIAIALRSGGSPVSVVKYRRVTTVFFGETAVEVSPDHIDLWSGAVPYTHYRSPR